ncbi:MAG: putative iron-sulfur protein [Verrucomicrobiales bacterium]|nr:putative iron-sulfur protein [Verrucomicrobiales bacterium]
MQLSSGSRRHFVRTLAIGGAVSIIGRIKVINDLSAQIVPNTANTSGLIRVHISDFPGLQSDRGSFRFGINPSDLFGPDGMFYPVMINRGVGTIFYAMTTQCQHAGCMVESYTPDNFGILCRCHNSMYDIDGSVLRGPTIQALPRYEISFDGNDTLAVQVPKLGYNVDLTVMTGTSGPRVRLDFPTFPNAVYELQYREKLTDSWSMANFALSLDGGLDEVAVSGTGEAQSIWAAKQSATGFYSVSIKLLNYG